MNNSINYITSPNFGAKQRALYKLTNGETVKLLELGSRVQFFAPLILKRRELPATIRVLKKL